MTIVEMHNACMTALNVDNQWKLLHSERHPCYAKTDTPVPHQCLYWATLMLTLLWSQKILTLMVFVE